MGTRWGIRRGWGRVTNEGIGDNCGLGGLRGQGAVTERRYRSGTAGTGVEEEGGRLGEDDKRIRTGASEIMAHLQLEVAR